MKKIAVCDITLKKLAEERNTGLLFREKTAIAKGLDEFGAGIVALPAIKNVREDSIIYKTIALAVQHAELSITAGYTEENIKTAFESIKEAHTPRLVVSLPVSTVTMEYMFHLKEAKMLEKIASLVSCAASLCENVEFEAKDATRANPAFLINALKTAIRNGAKTVCIVDDEGTTLPGETEALVREIKKEISVPLFIEVNDTLHLASANALAAILAGADGVKTAIAGKNILHTGDFCDFIACKGEKLGLTAALKYVGIHRDISLLLKKINPDTVENKGVSIDSAAEIFLDDASTETDVNLAIASLGYDLSEDDKMKVFNAVKRVCEKKNGVEAKELEAVIASYAMQVPATYHLRTYTVTSGNKAPAMASVILETEDEALTGVASGDGPIDAAFKAVEQCVGCHYELDNFEIQAVTEGKEALGSTVVRLRKDGKLYSGTGLSTDIIGAGLRAYINALNKIAAQKEE